MKKRNISSGNKILKSILLLLSVILIGISIPYVKPLVNIASNYKDMLVFKTIPPAKKQLDLLDSTVSKRYRINGGHADFSKKELSLKNGNWQNYSNLDNLNRAGQADAMLSKKIMPTKKRENLTWTPTGFHNKNIGNKSDSHWLYDRTHLIGYQLTGQNNNPKNLITGTRSLNVEYMEPLENKIANYLKTHPKNHVRYRVKPIFSDNELVAHGIQIEAQSLEDNSLNFNFYLLNVQDSVPIDYLTGYCNNLNTGNL